MTIDYAAGGRLLDAYARALDEYDGDAFVDLFTDDAEYHEDPFEPPLVGHNAIRAWLLDASRRFEQAEFTIERHWVSGDTVLAAWHSSVVVREGNEHGRMAGFMTLEVGADGRIVNLRQWWNRRSGAA